MTVPHRFAVSRPGRPPVPWDPPEPTLETGEDVTYWGRVFALVRDRLGTSQPLTFVLTWDMRALPEEGGHVVAVSQGDEDARFPLWANRVRCTFKCYGTRPVLMADLSRRPRLVDLLEVAHYLRRAALWLPGAFARAAWPPRRGRRPPVVPVPLGYYNQVEVEPIPFRERRWSVSFAGSGTMPDLSRVGWRHWVGTPKAMARMEMLRALETLRQELPEQPISTVLLSEFPSMLPGEDQATRTMKSAYSELLGNTRVCLVPRGNSPETFRYFEALRAGCVVVCETLPEHWFYREAPVLRLRRWSDLPELLRPYLADMDRLEALHRESLEWWRERCSEDAVARFIAQQLGNLS